MGAFFLVPNQPENDKSVLQRSSFGQATNSSHMVNIDCTQATHNSTETAQGLFSELAQEREIERDIYI